MCTLISQVLLLNGIKREFYFPFHFQGDDFTKRYHMGVKNESKSERLQTPITNIKNNDFHNFAHPFFPAWPLQLSGLATTSNCLQTFCNGPAQYYLNAVSKSFYCLWYELKLLTKHHMLVTSGFQVSADFHYNQKSASLYIYIPIIYVMEGMIIYLFICAYLV